MSTTKRTAAAIDRFVASQLDGAPVPSADVLARPITKADIDAYPAYFILGPGQDIASATDCPHGYRLTDSCPCCD
jgi:hypothetical protein